jgi:hypothetical protein
LLSNLNPDDKDVDIKVTELKNRASELRDQISKLSNHHKGMALMRYLKLLSIL